MKIIFKNSLFLAIFSIITLLGTSYAKASFAAEPHRDEHLHKYADKPEFKASVSIKDCSASRIKIDEKDPIDFYITAAHCVDPVFIPHAIESALIRTLKEIDRFSSIVSLDQIKTEEILEKYLKQSLNSFSESEITRVLGVPKAEFISNIVPEIDLQIKGQLENNSAAALLSLMNTKEERKEIFQPVDTDYIKHPELDLAVFTNNKQSDEPKYSFYTGELSNLVGKSVTSVAFGSSLLNEFPYSPERQAFDTTIESTLGKAILRSIDFKPDLNKNLEDNPIGVVTEGDSGGSLLIKERNEYKLAGVAKSIRLITPSLSFYEEIPESLRSNPHNQYCFQEIRKDPKVELEKACYGSFSQWTGIDLDFIKKTKKDILTKKPVYAYPLEAKDKQLTITFLVKGGLNTFDLLAEENFIGYFSEYAKLAIVVNGEERFAIPFQLGTTSFVYQVAGKHYPIVVTIDQTVGAKGFIVKADIHNKEKDQCRAHNLNDLAVDKNKNERSDSILSFARPIYYSSLQPHIAPDLPLKVSLDKCLSHQNFIDTDLLKDRKDMEILGYAGDNYEVVLDLNGHEFKRFNNKELLWREINFECRYAGKNYAIKIVIDQRNERNADVIHLNIKQIEDDKTVEPVQSTIDLNKREDSKFIQLPVRYSFTNGSEAIAQHLGLTVDIMNKTTDEEDGQTSLKEKFIGYGNANSIARVLLHGGKLSSFKLEKSYDSIKLPKFGKNGESYSLKTEAVLYEGICWEIVVDIQEIEKEDL